MTAAPPEAGARPIPLLGEISLEYVQQIEHQLEGGFTSLRIAGLPGELQQRSARPSHAIHIRGLLFGESAADALSKLQEKAAAGEEMNFAADITSALDLQKVVITAFAAREISGQSGRYIYNMALRESPPLPPPAQVSGFGGLDDFGLGDLGFDTDILGDLTDMAGDIASAVNDAMDVIDKLEALASLGELGELGDFMQPVENVVGNVEDLAARLRDATRSLGDLFSS